ncbi:MAG: heat-inducible transcriptional repressor HrcA, partial [Alcanivorax sp.]|nr:heat-inducible transcriptional repressor HrcA [Alcanivorax sp.]
MTKLDLNERKQRLLMALVERHIRDGQPVGSKTLASGSGLTVSPATVRNIMAELEDLGVLASPHTSAGRVPTELGYRLYVDSLLASSVMERPDHRSLKKELRQLLAPEQSPQELIAQASRTLAELTRMAGLVAVPRREVTTLRQVEFLPLSGKRVLVVLVVNRSEVQNRIIHTDRDYDEAELRQAANYINHTYGGCDLNSIC